MRVGMHLFRSESVEWLMKAVREENRTRSSLAAELCAREDWLNHLRQPCLASARRALPKLCAQLGVTLPPPRRLMPGSLQSQDAEWEDSRASLTGSLDALGSVSLRLVSTRSDRRQWQAMMRSQHPLGWVRPPGSQLRYWIESSAYGTVGGIGFCAASWHQRARDEFIGWSADARAAHLGQVLNNIRFLILPRVRVAGLASSALAQAARRLPEDWKAETGVSALMAYTYVGAQHRGSCYAAAGWQRCERLTAGRPPGPSSGSSEPRAVWMKPLSDSWQDELCVEPRRRIGEGKSWHVQETADWAEVEYARGSHPDGRVRNRILRMGRAWLNRPGEPLPTIFPAKADQKAAYRLMSSGRVKMDHILASHQEALAERCRFEPLVLALQDSTTLNYHGLKSSRGLALIGSNRTSLTMGLPVHLGLACTPAGRPLGVFELNADFRDPPKSTPSQPAQLESARWTQGLERAQELSRACPETRVVTVCDREGDQWDMLNQAIDAKAGLLVRASRSTRRRVLTETGEPQDLWSWMAMQPPRARKCIELQACGGTRARKRRKIDLELRVTSVRLQAPKRARRQEPIEMLAVSATEVQPVEGETALHWLLLSTEGEADAETAARLVKWYEQRWSIEEYFKVLKSGARVEERQLDAAEDLRKCLAFDAITACHVFDLTRMAREEPARKATELVDQDEIEML